MRIQICREYLFHEIRRSICLLPLLHKEIKFFKRFLSRNPTDFSCDYGDTAIYVNWVDNLRYQSLCILKQLYTKELNYFLAKTDINSVRSILFGCERVPPPSSTTVKHLLMQVDHRISPTTDITLEIDPNYCQISLNKLWEYRISGINRICLRIKDHNNWKELKKTFQSGMDIFPNALSVDLCCMSKSRRLNDWNCILLELANIFSHIKIEECSKSAEAASFLQQYNATQQILTDFGFEEYKFCHFAKSDRARSRYMTLLSEGAQYIGLGPFSHGRLNLKESRLSYVNEKDSQDWIRCLMNKSNAIRVFSKLTKSEIVTELLIQGLDTERGIPNHILKNYLSNLEIERLLQNDDIKECIKHEFLIFNSDKLAIPQSAWLVSNSIILKVLNALNL